MNVPDLKHFKFDQDTDLSNNASEFLNALKSCIRKIQEAGDSGDKAEEDTNLAKGLESFYAYAVQWATTERAKYEKVENHPEAAKLKQAAAGALQDLQANIINFCLCYTQIGRSIFIVHKSIKNHESKTGTTKDFKWTADTGDILKRYQKERKALLKSNDRLLKGEMILEKVAGNWSVFEDNLQRQIGAEAASESLRSLRSALRTGDFSKAYKVIDGLKDKKKKFKIDMKSKNMPIEDIQAEAKAFTKALQDAGDLIHMDDGKLFLTSGEIVVVLNAQEREIEQKSRYIDKYHQPYMENKLKSLAHLREKLLVVGSLESLITLYIRLIRGLAVPMKDIKDVREYESQVIDNVNYLLGGQFQEVDRLSKWLEDTMQEFDNSMGDFQQNTPERTKDHEMEAL